MKKITSALLCAALMLSLACPALAAEQANDMEAAAAYLLERGVMVGDGNGDMRLNDGLNRAELATILARMKVNQEHLMADKAYYAGQCTFTDVPEWARVYVGYCATNYIVTGYGGNLYGSYDPVTPAAACTVMLRSLGRPEADWSYRTAVQKAVQLELAPMDALTGAEITRGNMAILVYRTMMQMNWDSEDISESTSTEDTNIGSVMTRNTDGSINVPMDGSRYIPQAGDVVRCDDGTNYTITDVSRYDKSMFASGPLPELPEATCDWNSFPEVELPAAEARHFDLDAGNYLFIRNLYESRRMQYTIQNLAGNHPDTSEGGKLRYGSKGTPAVRIQLTIDESVTPQSFWPWRDSELERLFNSCPAGSYQMEAWDVFRNGIFLYTEYKVYAL